jgi:hypothetical protein
MKKITIKLLPGFPFSDGRFQVIGRNIEITDNSKTHFSTTFTATTKEQFDIELNKLKNEYKLFHVVQGKNKNNEVIVQLTEKEVV